MTAPGLPPGLKIAYYGDDFTGASDTLATAAQAGLEVLLFIDVPTRAQLAAAGELDVLGIAGTTRSLRPEDMAPLLERAGRFMADLDAPVLHYKICSTFDSSPTVGNIGCAVETLLPHVDSRWVPFVGGQPNLRRYCLFGNLFASAGLGGPVHRIDRHPTMSQHPVTPMREADLRVHLAQQGFSDMGLMPYPEYARGAEALAARLPAEPAADAAPATTLFDIATPADLAPVGRLIWERATRRRLLAVGPSTVVQVLASHWGCSLDARPDSFRIAPAASPVFLLCGSLSPVTAAQAACSTAFLQLRIDAEALAADAPGYRERMRADICGHLGAGRHVLAATAPPDGGGPTGGVSALALARACGTLLRAVLDSVPLKRVGVAGGDTSSYALSALDAWALAYAGALSHGVPLTRIRSDAPGMDGLEIMLKGGQMGPPDLFDILVRGSPG